MSRMAFARTRNSRHQAEVQARCLDRMRREDIAYAQGCSATSWTQRCAIVNVKSVELGGMRVGVVPRRIAGERPVTPRQPEVYFSRVLFTLALQMVGHSQNTIMLQCTDSISEKTGLLKNAALGARSASMSETSVDRELALVHCTTCGHALKHGCMEGELRPRPAEVRVSARLCQDNLCISDATRT